MNKEHFQVIRKHHTAILTGIAIGLIDLIIVIIRGCRLGFTHYIDWFGAIIQDVSVAHRLLMRFQNEVKILRSFWGEAGPGPRTGEVLLVLVSSCKCGVDAEMQLDRG